MTSKKNLLLVITALIFLAGIPIFSYINNQVKDNQVKDQNESVCTNEFPISYEIDTVTIYAATLTMVGPRYTVIYGDGDFGYSSDGIRKGGYGSGAEIVRAGKLAQSKIEEILNTLRDKHFFCLNKKYERSPWGFTDQPGYRLFLAINGRVKVANGYLPQSAITLVRLIESAVEELPIIDSDKAADIISIITKENQKVARELQ